MNYSSRPLQQNVWPAILAGAASLAGNLIQGAQARENYKMQYQGAVDQWQRQARYDSVANQMARYRSAGFNPDLLQGDVGGSTPNADLPNNASIPAPNLANGVASNALAAEQAQANIENVRADTELKAQEASLKIAQKAEVVGRTLLPGTLEKLTSAQILETYANIERSNKQLEVLASQRLLNEANAKYIDAKTDWQKLENANKPFMDALDRKLKEIGVTRESIGLQQMVEKFQYELKEFEARTRWYNAQSATEEQKKYYYAEQAEFLKSQRDKIAQELEAKTFKREFDKLGVGDDGKLNAWGYIRGSLEWLFETAGNVISIGAFGHSKIGGDFTDKTQVVDTSTGEIMTTLRTVEHNQK